MRGTAEPFRKASEIAAELVARLGAINGAPFETTMGALVFQGRQSIDRDRTPCVTIIEGDDVPERRALTTTHQITQGYVLMAHLRCEDDNPNVAAHAGLRDLKRAIFTTNGKPDTTLGGRAVDVAYIGRQMSPRDAGQKLVVVLLEVAVRYVEDLANP